MGVGTILLFAVCGLAGANMVNRGGTVPVGTDMWCSCSCSWS